jgi:tRNA (cytidine/uridine-2'-O-)-methyltransferase
MEAPPRLALYEPDIPQNVGAAIRLAAGLGCGLDLIEPFGFVFEPRRLRRTALDYLAHANLRRHAGWTAFERTRAAEERRLILLTTAGTTDYRDVPYRPGDVLLAGAESAGVPAVVHDAAELRVAIPLAASVRSLNVVTALAMVAGEALRQLRPEGAQGGGRAE